MWVDLSFLKHSPPFNCPNCCSPIFLKIPHCKQCYAVISKRSLSGYTDTGFWFLVPKAVSHILLLKHLCFGMFIYVLIIFPFIGKILGTRNLSSGFSISKGNTGIAQGCTDSRYVPVYKYNAGHCPLSRVNGYLISRFKFTSRTNGIYRTKDAQSALYILNNKHEYGPINNIMFLLKQVNKDPLLHSFEQFYIQLYYHHNRLIPKQNTGE